MNISGVAGGNHDDECMKKPILGGDDIMALSLAVKKRKYPKSVAETLNISRSTLCSKSDEREKRIGSILLHPNTFYGWMSLNNTLYNLAFLSISLQEIEIILLAKISFSRSTPINLYV